MTGAEFVEVLNRQSEGAVPGEFGGTWARETAALIVAELGITREMVAEFHGANRTNAKHALTTLLDAAEGTP